MRLHWLFRLLPLFLLSLASLLPAVFLLEAEAAAQTPDTVFLDELTSPELRDAIRAGKTTVIIPSGGVEQNGPHMVLGKHNIIVRYAAERIARKLGNALVAPVLGVRSRRRPGAPGGPSAVPGHHLAAGPVFPRSGRGRGQKPEARGISQCCSAGRPRRQPGGAEGRRGER